MREIEYGLDTLKADGIGLFSNYGDIWLGDEKLKPIHEELNRRKAVVYVHPIEANCCRNIVKDVVDTVVEYGADTTRTIASLIFQWNDHPLSRHYLDLFSWRRDDVLRY